MKTKLRASKKSGKVKIELTVREYEKLLDDLDELDAIRAYDEAKNSGETPIPLDQALNEIERARR